MDYQRMEDDEDGLGKTPMTPSVQQAPPPPQNTAPALLLPHTPGPQVIILKKATAPVAKSKARPLLVLGVMQVSLGILMIIFNIAALAVRAFLSFIGAGIWVGILVVVCGAFGILSGKYLRRGYIITFLVLSIISAVFTWFVIGFAAGGLPNDDYGEWRHRPDGQSYYVVVPSRIAMNSMLIIIGLVEAVAAIVASAICCNAICCRQSSAAAGGQVLYQNQPGQQQQQYMLVQSGQNVHYMMPAGSGQPLPNNQYMGAQSAAPLVQPQPSQQPGMTDVTSTTPPPMYQTLPPPHRQTKA